MSDANFGSEYDQQQGVFVALGISKETYIKSRRVDEGIDKLPTPATIDFSAKAGERDQAIRNACQLAGKSHMVNGFLVDPKHDVYSVIAALSK